MAGLEFAGTIDSVGPGVTTFTSGDAVFGIHPGAFAEFVAVPLDSLARKPDAVSFEQTAAVPVSGLAALQAVRDAAKVQPGHRVLITGASGAVGSCAVQIAKAFGASVTGVASTRNLEAVRRLGADVVIDYTRDDPTAGREHYDAVIDIAGNRAVSRLRAALVPSGALVIVGGSGSRWTMGFERTIGAMLLAPFVRQRIVGLISKMNQRDLDVLAELMSSRKLVPVVRRRYSMDRVAEAVEDVGSGGGSGTAVLCPLKCSPD